MNTIDLKTGFKQPLLLAIGLSLLSPMASASNTWLGNADYTQAPGATGDENLVTNFDTYDFGLGVALIKDTPDSATTGTISGWYQSRVKGHSNSVDFSEPSSPALTTTGSGSGYELTAVATFSGTYQNSGLYRYFTINSGNVGLYFDTTPDSNFTLDSGFKSDPSAPNPNYQRILWGSITTGEGSVKIGGSNVGSGYEELAFNFGGTFGGYDAAVYSPDTIGGGNSIFAIKTQGVSLLTSVNSVLGESKVGGALFATDGNLQLTAVPVPAAVWLFGTGLVGLLTGAKRRKTAA